MTSLGATGGSGGGGGGGSVAPQYREDDLVDLWSDDGSQLVADGVVTAIVPDTGRAVVVVMSVFAPADEGEQVPPQQQRQQPPRLGGVDVVPGATLKLRAQQVTRKDWRDTLAVAVERQVEHLDLSRYFYALDEFPANVFMLRSLKRLDLNLNSLKALPHEISYLEFLVELNLSNNEIAHLPDEIGALSRLQILDLRNNGLMDLPEDLSGLTSITTLYLQDNRIRTLPASIGTLQSLEVLHLSSNMLLSVPDEIGQAANLELINFRGNRKLRDLPQSFGRLERIWWLGLDPGFAGIPQSITDNPRHTAQFVRQQLS